MANIVFNIALGRVVELYNRVDTNDPANSVLRVVILATTGIETDAVLKDKATLADVVAGTTNFVTNTGYAAKELSDTDLTAFTTDNVNDRTDLSIPNQTWTNVQTGDGWNDLVVCYDNDSTAGTDGNVIPLTLHDFVVVPDGSNITAQISSSGFFRAQ